MGIENTYGLSIDSTFKLNNEEIEMCCELISRAKNAFSDPNQSGFQVRAAGVTEDGHFITGGNKENSHSDAFVHGETAVVSRIRDEYGKTPIRAIGFYKEGDDISQGDISPCGACRDVLIQQTSPDLILVSGNENKIVVNKLKNFLFENFHPIEPKNLDKIGINDAKIALNRGVDVYLPKDLKKKIYGVTIIDQNMEKFRGSLYTNAGYDAITPGLAAVQTWNNSSLKRRTDIEEIVFVSKENIPSPFYRDRAALSELADITSLFNGRETSIRVTLIQLDELFNIKKAAITDTDEWLPLPFSARSFGMDEAIENQYNKMFH